MCSSSHHEKKRKNYEKAETPTSKLTKIKAFLSFSSFRRTWSISSRHLNVYWKHFCRKLLYADDENVNIVRDWSRVYHILQIIARYRNTWTCIDMTYLKKKAKKYTLSRQTCAPIVIWSAAAFGIIVEFLVLTQYYKNVIMVDWTSMGVHKNWPSNFAWNRKENEDAVAQS